MYRRGLLPDRIIFEMDDNFAVSNGEILTEQGLVTEDGSLISDLYSYLAHASGREVTNDFEASDMLIADEVYQA